MENLKYNNYHVQRGFTIKFALSFYDLRFTCKTLVSQSWLTKKFFLFLCSLRNVYARCLLSVCYCPRYGHCNTSYKCCCIKILSNFFLFFFFPPQQEIWKAVCTTDFCQKIRVHLFTFYNCLSSQQIVLWLWHKALNLDKAARLTPLKMPTPPSGEQVLFGWIWLGGQADVSRPSPGDSSRKMEEGQRGLSVDLPKRGDGRPDPGEDKLHS